MNTPKIWIFGLAALGLALAAPVQAAPDFMGDAFIVAQRDRGDEARRDRSEIRKDESRAPRREAGREEPRGYGYGYERRQQQRYEDEDRPRERRQHN